ncbi:hypothetical protein Vafri_22180 [Volvox africanus]|uniref:Uncharacterized protein n=1 Tax=Volvox africanus TaxID=51714 RepID=A0A8J4BVF8_9CHLO|nr:hypothetical protein Vafri_22180 [Volvox africanus]
MDRLTMQNVVAAANAAIHLGRLKGYACGRQVQAHIIIIINMINIMNSCSILRIYNVFCTILLLLLLLLLLFVVVVVVVAAAVVTVIITLRPWAASVEQTEGKYRYNRVVAASWSHA